MDIKLKVAALFLFATIAHGQIVQQVVTNLTAVVGSTPIALDVSCTGTGSTSSSPCSAPMTVAAGDDVTVECGTNNNSFDPSNIVVSDQLNGFYKNIWGNTHPTNADDWVTTAVLFNSAGGSVLPSCLNFEPNGFVIAAQAWKHTATSFGLDGGAVNQFKSATTAAANPTSSASTAAPTNANELVLCQLVRATAATTSAGTGWTPTGTLTGVTNTLAQYFQYMIQTTATAENCPFTSASAKYTDGQFALLNASNPAGYDALTGVFGPPAAAQTNGATVTAAILNGVSGSLSTISGSNGSNWTASGGAAMTFDTSVHPLGTYKLLVNGTAHTIGDAVTSVHIAASSTAAGPEWAPNPGSGNPGTGVWYGSFVRVGTNATSGENCDVFNLDGTLVEGNFTTQFYYDGTHGLNFQFEVNQGNSVTATGLFPSPALNLGQDYYVATHVAGINEPNDELFILGEATPGTLPWVVVDHFTFPKTGPIQATPTGTGTSGASTFTVSSATGIVVGQSAWSASGNTDSGQIPLGATVTSITGTTVSISPATLTANMSSTPLIFGGPLAHTTASTTAGSTTLTVTSGTGIVAGDQGTGQLVAMAGVTTGTWVASGSGTSWVLSQPAAATESTVIANFWPWQTAGYEFHFGKYSSCTSTADYWFSGMIIDPYGLVLPGIANGTNPL